MEGRGDGMNAQQWLIQISNHFSRKHGHKFSTIAGVHQTVASIASWILDIVILVLRGCSLPERLLTLCYATRCSSRGLHAVW
jgi:hypothetical protein